MTTAIVTGASQGIGEGIVKVFVARGFNAVAVPTSSPTSESFLFSPVAPAGVARRMSEA